MSRREWLFPEIFPSNDETRYACRHSKEAQREQKVHARQVDSAVKFLKTVDVWIFFHKIRLCHNCQRVKRDVWCRHLHPPCRNKPKSSLVSIVSKTTKKGQFKGNDKKRHTNGGRNLSIQENANQTDWEEKEVQSQGDLVHPCTFVSNQFVQSWQWNNK